MSDERGPERGDPDVLSGVLAPGSLGALSSAIASVATERESLERRTADIARRTERELAHMKEAIEQLTAQREELDRRIAAERQRVRALEADLSAHDATLAAGFETRGRLRRWVSVQQERIAVLDAEVGAAADAVAAATVALTDVTARLAADREAALAEMAALEERARAADDRGSAIQTEMDALSRELAEARAAATEAELGVMFARTEGSQAEVDRARATLDSRRRAVDGVIARLLQREHTLREARVEAARLRGEAGVQARELPRREARERATAEAQVAHALAIRDEAARARDHEAGRLAQLEAELARLDAEVARRSQDRERLAREVADPATRHELDEELAVLTRVLDDAEFERERLESFLRGLR